MKIFNFEITRSNTTTPAPVKETIRDEVFDLSVASYLPKIQEQKNSEYVKYGEDNDYPTYLEDLYSNSPTHQAIIDTKSLLIAGDGYELNDTLLTETQKLDLYRLLEFIDGKHSVEEFLQIISKDMQLYGAVCLEVIWSLDFEQIVKLNRISPKHIRSGKYVDGKVETYFYKRDWNDKREEYVEIPTFDIYNKDEARQLFYLPQQLISNDYYGEPSYLASINWIELETQTGVFYKSLIENGFNPSMIVKFYRKPASLQERREVVNELKRNFAGVKNTGKVLSIFSDGKELAPDVEAINTTNLDKQFLALADQIQSKILTGGRISTPELFGITTPGKLGNSDYATQIETFQKFVIRPEQIIMEKLINKILKINGFNVDFKIKPFEITTNQPQQQTL